jgi:putative FmdB family regulatory protein
VPIYEYVCKTCDHTFEALLRSSSSEAPACESCGGREVERLISTPYVKSETTKEKAMRAAKKRDQKAGHERTQEQLAYERSHND